MSHVPVLSSGSSRPSGCRRRTYTGTPQPSASSSGHSVHYRAQRGPRKTPDPATTTSTHHHRQLIVTRPPPNGSLRIEKETKTLHTGLSRHQTQLHQPSLLCLAFAVGLAPRLVSNPVSFCASRSPAEGPSPRPLHLVLFQFFPTFYRFFPISFKCLRSSWTDLHQLPPHPPPVPPYHLIWTSRLQNLNDH